MQSSEYPSPPPSEAGTMDRGQRLPPITTQLAGYFQQQNPNTPPVSPDDSRLGDQSSLKRKRSSADESAIDRAQQTKRPVIECNASDSATAASYPRGHSQRPSEPLSSSRMQAPSPAMLSTSTPNSSHKQAPGQSPKLKTVSPQSGQPHTSRSAQDGYFGASTYAGSNAPVANNVEGDSSYSCLSQTGRSLPPLVTPLSPRSAVDGKFDPPFQSGPRESFPLFGRQTTSHASAQTRYPPYAPYGAGDLGPVVQSREVPDMTSDNSSYSYTSSRRTPVSQVQPPVLQQPFTYEAPRSSYSFDPVRGSGTSSYAHDQQRVALPSMPGLTDPIPPPQQPQLMSHGTTSPSHSLERWRFDGNQQADHPARRRRGNLPKEATARLNDWFAQHAAYPYPKEEEKQRLQEETGLSMSQIGNWFINARRRRKPTSSARPIDTLPPPHAPRHSYAGHGAPPTSLPPSLSAPLPPPHPGQGYDYSRLPPPYGPSRV